jgi:hypothetical protein
VQFLKQVPNNCGLPRINKFRAVDGENVPIPNYWLCDAKSRGAWGCYQSHVECLNLAFNRHPSGSVLILEDDAKFVEDFDKLFPAFMATVPKDWDVIYLGGEHTQPPIVTITETEEFVPTVAVPRCVARSHAYIVSDRVLPFLIQHLRDNVVDEVDRIIWDFVSTGFLTVYCPQAWLVGQAGGLSDLEGRVHPDRFWNEVIG